jgi:hypothetical protein
VYIIIEQILIEQENKMNNLSTEDKTMIAEGAEFKVNKTYFKHIKGVLFSSLISSDGWTKAFAEKSDYKLAPLYTDLVQRTETPVPQETSSKQGDCISDLVHSLCTELRLTYSYHPAEDMFLVDYNDTTFKLKTSDDVGKLRHLVNLVEELSYDN